MAVDVDRDSADSAVFHLIVEPARAHELFELAAALGNLEPAVLDLLETVIAREIIRAVARQKHVGPLLEQAPG